MSKTYIAILVELAIGGTRFIPVHQLRIADSVRPLC